MKKKNRIFKAINGRTRVFITDDLSDIVADENTLINPSRHRVKGLSPEHVEIRDGELWPLEDEELLAEINAYAASGSPDDDLKKVKILQQLDLIDKRIQYQNASLAGLRVEFDEKLRKLNKQWTIISIISTIGFLILKFL